MAEMFFNIFDTNVALSSSIMMSAWTAYWTWNYETARGPLGL